VKIKPSDLKNHPGIQWLVPHPSPDGHIYYRTDLNAVKQRIKSLGRECKTRDEFNYVGARLPILCPVSHSHRVDTLVTEYAECRMAVCLDVFSVAGPELMDFLDLQGCRDLDGGLSSMRAQRTPAEPGFVRTCINSTSRPLC
jgi:hypothetical protein